MKIGMPILYEFNNLEDNFKFAMENGFDFIELNLNFGYCQREVTNYKHLKNLISLYNIEVTMHFFDEADFGTYDLVCDAYTELLLKYIKNPIKCGLKNLIIHINEGPVVTISGVKNYIYEKEFDTYSKKLIKNLLKIKKHCDKYNVKLCLENSKTVSYMSKIYECLINNGFEFAFDIGHNMICNNLVRNIYESNKEKFIIDEFHIHDVALVNGSLVDHVSLGCGTINIKDYYDLAVKLNSYALLELKSTNDLTESINYFKNINK